MQKNNFLLLKKLKNTESAQLWLFTCVPGWAMSNVSKSSLSWQMLELHLQAVKVHGDVSEDPLKKYVLFCDVEPPQPPDGKHKMVQSSLRVDVIQLQLF